MFIITIILGIIVIGLSIYSVITGISITQYTMLFFGLFVLTRGISEIKNKRKGIGVILVALSLFVFYVSIQYFLVD